MPEAFPNGSKPADRGLLLVGHGTRDAEGLAEFASLARLVMERLPEFVVEPCFWNWPNRTFPRLWTD